MLYDIHDCGLWPNCMHCLHFVLLFILCKAALCDSIGVQDKFPSKDNKVYLILSYYSRFPFLNLSIGRYRVFPTVHLQPLRLQHYIARVRDVLCSKLSSHVMVSDRRINLPTRRYLILHLGQYRRNFRYWYRYRNNSRFTATFHSFFRILQLHRVYGEGLDFNLWSIML